ncbi:uncharacterized protein LOC111060684 isoform X2 [Nilaparvata lugens]|uniref:uncharacterized protein LOC111060684 isoform X2 n=1 Tax=Nilaparvata lugens TaxID=108931 RepID=UPI00193E2131|nr:uncharacterized protein LOC111060684 isoform X2 [Nilaparvata lugens]
MFQGVANEFPVSKRHERGMHSVAKCARLEEGGQPASSNDFSRTCHPNRQNHPQDKDAATKSGYRFQNPHPTRLKDIQNSFWKEMIFLKLSVAHSKTMVE